MSSFVKCHECGVTFTGHYKSMFCSRECNKAFNEKKKVAESHEKFNENNPDEWVECRECGFRSGKIVTKHLKTHGFKSFQEYVDKYPNTETRSVTYKKYQSERMKGDKNPGYQHGGRLSPFSKDFVGYEGMSVSEKEKKVDSLARQAENTRTDNDNVTTRLSYYTSRGYTEDEAKLALYERQRTFTLEKCIEKHGDKEGRRIWQERQDRWQETLNVKDDKEIARINASKAFVSKNDVSQGRQRHQYENSDENAELYVFVYKPFIDDEQRYIKYGITKRGLESRWKPVHIDEVIMQYHGTAPEVYALENRVKRWVHESDRMLLLNPEERFDGWTESLRMDDREALVECVNKVIEEGVGNER